MKFTEELIMSGIQENISMSEGSQPPNCISDQIVIPLAELQITKTIITQSSIFVREANCSSSATAVLLLLSLCVVAIFARFCLEIFS